MSPESSAASAIPPEQLTWPYGSPAVWAHDRSTRFCPVVGGPHIETVHGIRFDYADMELASIANVRHQMFIKGFGGGYGNPCQGAVAG